MMFLFGIVSLNAWSLPKISVSLWQAIVIPPKKQYYLFSQGWIGIVQFGKEKLWDDLIMGFQY